MAEVGVEGVERWKRRPLEERYVVIFLDATFIEGDSGIQRARGCSPGGEK
jgi:hypothetical protein